MQVHQAGNSTGFSDDVARIAKLKMQGSGFDNLGE
jgi:hypothetical protein